VDDPVILLDFERIWPSVPYILQGVQVTLAYTGVSLCLGFVWGMLLALCKVSHINVLKWFASFYTSVFRGTPLLLQLTLIYYATPQLTGYTISIWEAGILTFALNSGAYVSEHIRGGINAIEKGQMEAALSLGIPYSLIMKDIILPQAIRNSLPSLVNEGIDLLKESTLISVIGGADILRRANIVASEKYLYFEPLLVAGFLYYVLIMILTFAAHLLEKKLKTT
jgi:His/Glu/Gln/Arg/opine family amino acid ABC transporter permease subunit